MKKSLLVIIMLFGFVFSMASAPQAKEPSPWLNFYKTVDVINQQGVPEHVILEGSIEGMLNSLTEEVATYNKEIFTINGKEFVFENKQRKWNDFYTVMDRIFQNTKEGTVSASLLVDGAMKGAKKTLYNK